MKKVVTLLLVAVLACSALVGCGNQSLGFGNFTFEHIHFDDNIESHCATIEKWYDNSEGIEVKTEEYGSMYLSEGTYVLIEDEDHCPYCGSEE